jgi:hypothetical protein
MYCPQRSLSEEERIYSGTQLLAEIYSHTLKNPYYKPEPNTKRRLDQKSYFDALGIKEPLALLDSNTQPLPATFLNLLDKLCCFSLSALASR